MRWGRRAAHPPREEPAVEPEGFAPPPPERASPGLAALFAGLGDEPRHAILDLGPAIGANLELYRRHARRVWFADLLRDRSPGAPGAALEALRIRADDPPDVVLAWDLPTRLPPDDRPALVERLAGLTLHGARLYLLVDTSGRPSPPIAYRLLSESRVAHCPAGERATARGALAPAEVGRLLEPFRIAHAFVLAEGVREYVAVRD